MVDISADDTDKNFDENERLDIDRYHSFEYLLNAIRKLEIPRLEINADRLMIELNWTDVLQTLIDYANQNVLRSFRLHLKMDGA